MTEQISQRGRLVGSVPISRCDLGNLSVPTVCLQVFTLTSNTNSGSKSLFLCSLFINCSLRLF